jgi:hypothetical protein
MAANRDLTWLTTQNLKRPLKWIVGFLFLYICLNQLHWLLESDLSFSNFIQFEKEKPEVKVFKFTTFFTTSTLLRFKRRLVWFGFLSLLGKFPFGGRFILLRPGWRKWMEAIVFCFDRYGLYIIPIGVHRCIYLSVNHAPSFLFYNRVAGRFFFFLKGLVILLAKCTHVGACAATARENDPLK